MHRLLFLAAFTLAACTFTPTQPPAAPEPTPAPALQPAEERTEPVSESELELELDTIERLLPTGILEIGHSDAPSTLLLFTEHHARYCREFQRDFFPQLQKDFIDPGLLKLQIAIFPLQKYEQSQAAATALLCAAEQGQGLALHNELSEKLDRERLPPRKYAEALALDMDVFDECTQNEGIALVLEQQQSLARSLGVSLVPTFFLNGEKLVGLPYYADLKGMIEEVSK